MRCSPDHWFPVWKLSFAHCFPTHYSLEPEHSCWLCSVEVVPQFLFLKCVIMYFLIFIDRCKQFWIYSYVLVYSQKHTWAHEISWLFCIPIKLEYLAKCCRSDGTCDPLSSASVDYFHMSYLPVKKQPKRLFPFYPRAEEAGLRRNLRVVVIQIVLKVTIEWKVTLTYCWWHATKLESPKLQWCLV